MEIFLVVFMQIMAIAFLVAVVVIGYVIWEFSKEVAEDTCKWKSSGSTNAVYTTSCEEEFHNANEGDPITDGLIYCPFCAGAIKT